MPKLWDRDNVKSEIDDPARFADPLSDVTRRERRLLLGVSLVLMAVVFGGLLPTEIQALGITLSAGQSSRLLWIGLGIQVYLLIGFWLYSTADLKAWAMDRERVFRESSLKQASDHTDLAPTPGDDEEVFGAWLYKKQTEFAELFRKELDQHFRVLSFRAFFERWVPIVVGAFALIATLYKILGGLLA